MSKKLSNKIEQFLKGWNFECRTFLCLFCSLFSSKNFKFSSWAKGLNNFSPFCVTLRNLHVHIKFFYFSSVMAFVIGLPVAQIILFCLAIGHDPTGLNIAVVNNELSESLLAQQNCPLTKGCNKTMLSCRYLEFLKNRSVIVVGFKFSIYMIMPRNSVKSSKLKPNSNFLSLSRAEILRNRPGGD